MSFYDPGFLTSNRKTDRERDAEKAYWQQRSDTARMCYRWATWLVLGGMAFVVLPTGLEKWHWHVVIGTASVITIFGVVMMFRDAVVNGLISLLFAWAILPGWIYAAPEVRRVVQDQCEVISKEWRRIL